MAFGGNDLGRGTLFFPGWRDALAAADLNSTEKIHYAREIVSFLHYCRVSHTAATVAVVRQYLAGPALNPAQARDALLWCFRAAHRESHAVAKTPPPRTRM